MLYCKDRSLLEHFLLRLRTSVYFILIPVLGILFFSCSNPSNKPSSNNSYQKVLDSTKHLYERGKYDQAIRYLDSASIPFKNLDIGQKFEYYTLNCNYFFHLKKNNARAMLYADSMLNLFDTPEKKLKYAYQYGLSFFSKGDVLFAENKYNEAYQYFYQGKLIAKSDINDCTLSDYSYRMGMIMYKQEHFRLAAENFKSSSKETEACTFTFESFYRRQELLNNTGLCYSKIDEPDSAMMYYTQALNYVNKYAVKFDAREELLDVARGVIYGNEGNVYIKENKFQLSKILLKKSIEINLRKGNDNKDAQFSELKLARIYYRINELDSLIDLLHVIRPQFESVKNPEAETDWNLLMSNYFFKKNDLEKALNYFITYDTLKDSIAKQDKGFKEADIAEQIRRLEKDNEVEALKKHNQQQDLYIKISSVFGIMSSLIFFLIFLNWRKSKRNLKTLGSLNHQINDQNYSLERTLEELKLSSQEKDRILRTVAHDLRNPIGGIASLTIAMAEDDYTHEQKELINLIKETSKNSLELINEILEVANNESITLSKELVEINAILSHSAELMRFKAAEKEQEIRIELLEKPVELLISRERIWRVISNLISNAIKFSPIGAIIYVKITDVGAEVEISIKDPGIGIPDYLKNKVFNTFTEAKRPGTAGEKSFGLGLSISQQIIEGHQGKIWFEANAEGGTTFYVRLPKR